MEYEEKRNVVYSLLKILRTKQINEYHRKTIFNIVMRIPNKTIKQKMRFIDFYGLNPQNRKRCTLNSIAEENNCTANAIRTSVVTIKSALTRISDEDISILKRIVNKHK